MAVYSQPGEYKTTKAHEPGPVMSEEDLKELGEEKKDSPYDSEEYLRRLRKVEQWWNESAQIQADTRQDRLVDHEYYDHNPWTPEEKEELEERGQEAVQFNMIAPAVDWLLGTERRTRMEYFILPRNRANSQDAQTKHKLFKYVTDINCYARERSRAFEDSTISGLGWLEVATRSDMTEDPIHIGYEDWRNVWYDSLSRSPDYKDGRFIFRGKWVDLDVAMTMFPERANLLKAKAFSGEAYQEDIAIPEEAATGEVDLEEEIRSDVEDYSRARVRLMECWYKSPARVQVIRGSALGTLDGEIYDPEDEGMLELVESGHASVVDAVKMEVRCMIFSGGIILQDMRSPYRHNRFPLVPVWGKRRKKDNSPYGMVRGLRSPQSDLNKRRSKALFILSSNRIVADEDATEDWDAFKEEAEKPDGLLLKKKDREVELHTDTNLAESHVRLMDQDAAYIQESGGVTNENMGRDTNAESGKAIIAKQAGGELTTIKYFDRLADADQLVGELVLSLIEQFYDAPKQVRILGDKGKMEWVDINQEQEDGTLLNDITASKADFIISRQEHHDSVRQAMFDMLSEMIAKLDPQTGLQLLDMVVEMSDMPGRQELVNRIREINGMPDPFADPDDPEARKKAEAREQAKAEEQELQKRQAIAEVEKAQADVEKAKADTQQSLHEAKKTEYEAIMELAKVDTEKAKQAATRAGISFDEEKIRIEKAKALHEIQTKDDDSGEDKAGKDKKRYKHKNKKDGQYHEKGLKSNNEKNQE